MGRLGRTPLSRTARFQIGFERSAGSSPRRGARLCRRTRRAISVADLQRKLWGDWDEPRSVARHVFRSDLKGAQAQVRAAERAFAAARAERFPSLTFSANYGAIGTNPAQSHGTFSDRI